MASRMIAPISDTTIAPKLNASWLIDGKPSQRRYQPAAEGGTDDADDDIEQYSLLRICAHDQARDPADHASHISQMMKLIIGVLSRSVKGVHVA